MNAKKMLSRMMWRELFEHLSKRPPRPLPKWLLSLVIAEFLLDFSNCSLSMTCNICRRQIRNVISMMKRRKKEPYLGVASSVKHSDTYSQFSFRVGHDREENCWTHYRDITHCNLGVYMPDLPNVDELGGKGVQCY